MATRVVYCDPSDMDEVIKKAKKALTGQNIHAAMASALNRTLTFVGSETKRQVQGEYYVTKSINKSLSMKRATRRSLTAEANYQDKPLPLFVFKHKIPANQYRSPVQVTIKRSSGTKTVGVSEGAAVFGAYGGKKIERRDLTQKNLKTAYTVSIPQMVANPDVYDDIADKAEKKLIERFNHEIDWRIKKL